MHRFVRQWSAAASTLLLSASFGASAQAQAIKVGIVGPFSGPFAHYGTLFKNGVEAYVASQGGKLAGKDIEFIYRDTGGPNPGQTKTLVQELIVKDKVDYLGGFVFTPNAFAVAPLIQQSQTPTVIFNAATSAITDKSEFFIRTSYTLWQVTVPMAQWAATQNLKKVVTAVTDYGPGIDAEAAFKSEFGKRGGTVVESIRMPLATTDFAPFIQRIKASGAQAVYTFLPGGSPNLGFVKAYNENGLAKDGIRFLGYRVFADAGGRMNLSLSGTGGGLLLVPQFTLAADTAKGMRPGFTAAASPEQGRLWFERLLVLCRQRHPGVESGRFGAHMMVSLCNDGPVTFRLTS